MLPLYDAGAGSSSGATTAPRSLIEGFRTNFRYSHMDFEYALWLMFNLCISPRTAFRSTLYHSRTKHQWARDDPAFLVLLLYLLLVACAAWSVALNAFAPAQLLGLFLYHSLIDLLLLGSVLSTIGWWFANNYLHERGSLVQHMQPFMQPFSHHIGAWPNSGGTGGSLSAIDSGRGASTATARAHECVEWLYAFDVHCNAFVPLYVLLHVVQLLLLPLLLRPGFFYALLGNALYAAAFSAYHYLTFLGYSELPFLHRCECFVYPIAIVLLAFVLSLPLGINATQWVVSIYF